MYTHHIMEVPRIRTLLLPRLMPVNTLEWISVRRNCRAGARRHRNILKSSLEQLQKCSWSEGFHQTNNKNVSYRKI